jgi:hypothetical protein
LFVETNSWLRRSCSTSRGARAAGLTQRQVASRARASRRMPGQRLRKSSASSWPPSSRTRWKQYITRTLLAGKPGSGAAGLAAPPPGGRGGSADRGALAIARELEYKGAQAVVGGGMARPSGGGPPGPGNGRSSCPRISARRRA